MHTAAFAAKLEKVMIDGRAKFHSTVQITTWGRLIRSGTLQLFMVSESTTRSLRIVFKIPVSLYDFIIFCSAWAHLILYGEEATRKAQREGEEAAAAYEQEKKDIAEGKIPPPEAKQPKKKKKSGAPKKDVKAIQSKAKKKVTNKKEQPTLDTSVDATVQVDSQNQAGKKRAPASVKEWSTLKTECAMMLSSGTKGTSKVVVIVRMSEWTSLILF